MLGENGFINAQKHNFIINKQGEIIINTALSQEPRDIVGINNNQWEEMLVGDEPVISTDPDGRQRLYWYPTFSAQGRRVFIQTCQASGSPTWGMHYIEPSFGGNFGVVETGETGALGVAVYVILIDVEGVTYQVVVACDYTVNPPEMKIISYHIVE